MSKPQEKYSDDLYDIRDIPKKTVLRDWSEDGIRVLLVRSNFSINVYMGVPVGHPLAGKNYDDLPINCHGGLTYSNKGGDYLPEGYWWYGYDYAHSGDYVWHEHKASNLSDQFGDKKWTIGEIAEEAWSSMYDMKSLARLAESIAKDHGYLEGK